jgi:hypothetical protein
VLEVSSVWRIRTAPCAFEQQHGRMMELDQRPPNKDVHPDSEVYADDENIVAVVVANIVNDQQQSHLFRRSFFILSGWIKH